MYHSSLDKTNEAKVLKEFSKPDSSIRGVITIALGIGVHIPDIDYVIHGYIKRNP